MVLRGVGTQMGTDLPPRGGQPGPWEELGREEHAVKRKERKGEQLHGAGMSLQAEVPRAARQPGPGAAFMWAPGLWRQADRRVSPGKSPPWLRLLNHL